MTASVSPATPIRRKRLYEEVERHLEDEIVSGRLRVGDAIMSERDLTQRFAVGRPAIREALLSLQRKGLVRIGAGERTRVTRPTVDAIVAGVSGAVSLMLSTDDGVHNLQHARRFLECALAREVARTATELQIDRLKARLASNREALADPVAFERTDVEFHYEIALCTGNPVFASLHHAAVNWLLQQRTLSLMQPGAMRDAYKHHKSIFVAIAGRDPDAAEEAMVTHLMAVEKRFWKTAGAMRQRREHSTTG